MDDGERIPKSHTPFSWRVSQARRRSLSACATTEEVKPSSNVEASGSTKVPQDAADSGEVCAPGARRFASDAEPQVILEARPTPGQGLPKFAAGTFGRPSSVIPVAPRPRMHPAGSLPRFAAGTVLGRSRRGENAAVGSASVQAASLPPLPLRQVTTSRDADDLDRAMEAAFEDAMHADSPMFGGGRKVESTPSHSKKTQSESEANTDERDAAHSGAMHMELLNAMRGDSPMIRGGSAKTDSTLPAARTAVATSADRSAAASKSDDSSDSFVMVDTPLKNINGRPLEVIRVTQDTGEIELLKDNFDIIHRQLKELEERGSIGGVAIVSVAGAFRKGKSFLLDLFIHYLSTPAAEGASGTKLADENPDGDPMFDDLNVLEEIEKGHLFASRGSTDRVTVGIWMYSRVFVRPHAEVGNVGVILIDTQGLYDPQQANQKSVDINVFSLSLLLSSHQVLNLQGSITAMDLEMLQMFSEFANHAVSRLQRKGQHPEHNCDDSAQKEKSAFQGLEFLVRDFQFFSDIDDTAQCFADAESHLKKLFEFGHNQGQETHRRLEALFETITAAMLPHPGNRMTGKRWTGSFEQVDYCFKNIAAEYIRRIFSANMSIKTDLLRRPVTADLLRSNLIAYSEALSQSDQPKGLSLVQSIQEQHIATQIPLATAIFETARNTLTSEGSVYVPQLGLVPKLEEAAAKGHAYFIEQADFGSAERNESAAADLASSLDALIAASVLNNRRLLQTTLQSCVKNYCVTLQFETMEPASDDGETVAKPIFVERCKLVRFTGEALDNALAAFSEVGGDWYVEPDGPNADVLKHARIDLEALRNKCHTDNERLLAEQVELDISQCELLTEARFGVKTAGCLETEMEYVESAAAAEAVDKISSGLRSKYSTGAPFDVGEDDEGGFLRKFDTAAGTLRDRVVVRSRAMLQEAMDSAVHQFTAAIASWTALGTKYVREEALRANVDRTTEGLSSRFSAEGVFPAGASDSAVLKLANFTAALNAKTQECLRDNVAILRKKVDEAIQNFNETLNSATQHGKLYLPPPQLAEVADNTLSAVMSPFSADKPFEIGPERNMALLDTLQSACNRKVETAQRDNLHLFESQIAAVQAAIEDYMQKATRAGFKQEAALGNDIDAFVRKTCGRFERGQQYFHAEEEPLVGKYRAFRNGLQRRREDALRRNLRDLDGILATVRSQRDEHLSHVMHGAAYISEEKLQCTKEAVAAEIEQTLGPADGTGLVGAINWHKVSTLLLETQKMFSSKSSENRECLRKQVAKSVGNLKDSLKKLTATANGKGQRYIPHEALQNLIADQIAQATSPFRENGLWAIEVLNSELLTEATSDMHTYAEELSAQNDELLHCYAQLMLKKARALEAAALQTQNPFRLLPSVLSEFDQVQAEATAALGDGGAFEVGRRDAAVKQNLERDICALKEKAQAAICAHLEACIARKCNELEEFVERLLHDASESPNGFCEALNTECERVLTCFAAKKSPSSETPYPLDPSTQGSLVQSVGKRVQSLKKAAQHRFSVLTNVSNKLELAVSNFATATANFTDYLPEEHLLSTCATQRAELDALVATPIPVELPKSLVLQLQDTARRKVEELQAECITKNRKLLYWQDQTDWVRTLAEFIDGNRTCFVAICRVVRGRRTLPCAAAEL
eukprot:INCI5962.4.p1 GENE.INCI5962.4~~INCI5962.4.p1  ORF type:complete len:1651 (-),score=364.43 INCI5962.4:511-5463(-)